MLAKAGADVVLCSRSVAVGQEVADRLAAGLAAAPGAVPPGRITVAQLDLADLHSVEEFAKSSVVAGLPRIDLLVCNAGEGGGGGSLGGWARAGCCGRPSTPTCTPHPTPPPPPPQASWRCQSSTAPSRALSHSGVRRRAGGQTRARWGGARAAHHPPTHHSRRREPRGAPVPGDAAAAQDEGAGVCAPPFARRARVLERVLCAPAANRRTSPPTHHPQGAPARIVSLSSFGHTFAKSMPLDDLNWERRRYNDWEAYGQARGWVVGWAVGWRVKPLCAMLNTPPHTHPSLHSPSCPTF